LTFLVQEVLAGNPLKESIIGVAVFGREPGYDPKQDSVVRTEARRLRAKLVEYYAGAGANDELVIELPKGSYVPVFLERQKGATSATSDALAESASSNAVDQDVTTNSGATASGPVRTWQQIPYLIGAAAGVVVLLILTWFAVARSKTPATAAKAATTARRSVAVLAFHDMALRKETAWLANAIPEMLSADLAADSKVRTLPGETVTRMETELALQPTALLPPATLAAIRRDLGAEIVVSGGYAETGTGKSGHVRIQTLVQDTATGDTIASITENGEADQVLNVVSQSGERLRSALALESSKSAEEAARQMAPQNPEAARAYSDGLVLIRRGDLQQGRNLLEECVRFEPGFAPGRAALADAESRLGYEAQARDEARRAYELSSSLSSEEERLAIEAQFRLVNDEPARAAQNYARLLSMHPDDLEYGLELAQAEKAANQSAEALNTIQLLRKLPAPQSEDARIDMIEALVYRDRADYRRSAALAAEGARKAKQAGANLLYARALSFQSGTEWFLGDPRWRAHSEEVLAICRQFGDQACVAGVLRRFGNSDFAALNLQSAVNNLTAALRIAQQIGSVFEEGNDWNGLALVAHAQGDLRHSQQIQLHLLEIAKQTGNPRLEESSDANLGNVLLEAGQVDAAGERLDEAARIAQRVNDQATLADDLVNLAVVDRVRGDLADAGKLCDQGLSASRKAGVVPTEMLALSTKTRNLLAADDLAGARAAFQQYEQLKSSGVDMLALSDRAVEVEFALETGQAGTAATLATALGKKAEEQHIKVVQARMESLLAEALLAENKTVEARAAIDSAWAKVRNSQDQLTRMEIGITHAQLTRQAEQLQQLIAEARASDAYELELEARMAAAKLDGNAQSLTALRSQAIRHGFKHLARMYS
jgi:TolB-like protein